MEIINSRVLEFPDGTQRLHYSTKPYKIKSDEEKDFDKRVREAEKLRLEKLKEVDWWAWADEVFTEVCDFQGRPLVYIGDDCFFKYDTPDHMPPHSDSERKKIDNMKRAKQAVYNIARSNSFDLFLTLTFDPAKVDSFDYSAVTDKLQSFTKFLRRHNSDYVLVPEKHPTSGRYHFHGLCTKSDIELVQAVSPYTGELLFDEQGRPIFNLPQYTLGFSTATFVSDSAKAASYLIKYLTKDIEVPKGKKCYWASRSCSRPAVSYAYIDDELLAEFVEDSRFVKVTANDYGEFLIAENEKGGV